MGKTKNKIFTKAVVLFLTAAMLLCQPFSFLGIDSGGQKVLAAEIEWKTHHDPSQPFHSVESAHFRILYGDERPANKKVQITDEMLQGNLEHLEAIRDFYMNEIGMKDIGNPVGAGADNRGTRYKCNIYISGTGIGHDGWAFEALEETSEGRYACLTLDQDAMSVKNPQSTTIAHELAHAFTDHQNGYLDWDWYEPVAEFLTNEWQMNAEAYKDGPNTVNFDIFAKNTEWRYPSEKKWYEIWPILTYIYDNLDNYKGLGKEGILKLLQDSKTDDKSYYHKIERVMGVEIERILCGTIRRMVTMDFDNQKLYQGTLNRVKKDMYTSLEDAGDGWQKVPDAKMPQQTGFNIIPLSVDLKKTSISVDLEGTGSSANAGHTASIVTVTESGAARYSDMWHEGITSIKLRGDEKNAYLVVVATPKELEYIAVYNPGWNGVNTSDTERYPYKVKIMQNDETDNSGINIAPDAAVKADYSNTNTSVANVNDKELAGDSPSATWNTWYKDGDKEYPYPITMEWNEKQSIAGMKVMWWADDAEPGTPSGDGVLFPKSCQAEYYDEEQGVWKTITGMTDEANTSTDSVGVKYGTSSEASTNTGKYLLGNNRYWNEVKFAEKIETTKLRLRIDKPDNADAKSGIGIGEWQVITQYNIAPDAVVKADYSNTDTSTANINDRRLAWHTPKATWNTWCKDGNKEYPYPITMEWDKKQSLSGMKIMWWADDAEVGTPSGDGVLFPKSCQAQYYDEEQGVWKTITGMTDEANASTDSVGVKYGTSSESSTNAGEYLLGNNRYWNEVKFAEKIETTKLRLRIDKPDNTDGKSGIGIGEWQVYGEAASSQTPPVEEPVKYTVTLDANGGEVNPQSVEVEKGKKIGALPTPIKTDCTFEGWYTAKENGEAVTEETIANENMTIYAHWKVNQQTENPNPPTEQQITELNTKVAAAEELLGKLSNEEKGKLQPVINEVKALLKKENVTAKEIEDVLSKLAQAVKSAENTIGTVKYTVTLDANGGKVNPQSVEVEKGKKIGALPTPTKTDCTFEGWYTAKENGEAVTEESIVNENMTIYAHWKANQQTENPNPPTEQQITELNTKVAAAEELLGKLSNEEKGKLQPVINEVKALLKKENVTAKEIEDVLSKLAQAVKSAENTIGTVKYTVTLDANGGEVNPQSVEVEKGKKIGALPTPTKTDCTFEGWYTAKENGEAVTEESIVNENMTIYAHWKANQQTENPNPPTEQQITELNTKVAAAEELLGKLSNEEKGKLQPVINEVKALLKKENVTAKEIEEALEKLAAAVKAAENTIGSEDEKPKLNEIFQGSNGLKYKITAYKGTAKNTAVIGATKQFTSVTVPATIKYKGNTFKVTAVRDKALSNQKKLKKVIIGKYVTSIGKKAFYNDRKLTKVTFKGTAVKKIGKDAFKRISKKAVFSMKKTFTYKNLKYKITKCTASSKQVTVTGASKKRTSLSVPSVVKYNGMTFKITAVNKKAFRNQSKLKSVTVGKNVKSIGSEAFSGCKKLAKIKFSGTVIKSIGKNAFKNIKKNAVFNVKKSKKAFYKKLLKKAKTKNFKMK